MQDAVNLAGIDLAYGTVKVLSDIHLTIPPGSRTAIVGPNGAGKSSLMKVILGLEKPSRGTRQILGQSQDLSQVIRREVAYIPQSRNVNQIYPARVWELVLMGRFPHFKGLLKRPRREDMDHVEEALEKMNLQDLRHRQLDQLSGGQQQRVFLARALAQKASLYLMDEPLAGVDQLTEQMIMDTLKEFQQAGKTSIVVHHDLSTLPAYFDYLVWLNRSIQAAGPLDAVLTTANYQRTYQSQSQFGEDLEKGDWHAKDSD